MVTIHFFVSSFSVAQFVQWCRDANQIIWCEWALFSAVSLLSSIYSLFTVSPSSNKISLLKRQHWTITNMSESTNILGLSKSFENSNYSYPSHTTCIKHLSPSSFCYPWSPLYPTCFIIILQAICCSFILSMCPNHHKLYSQTLFPFLLTCSFLC